ncbi:PREDICTED: BRASSINOSTEROID INSENSITIVE 1-associated receptor kinase 1-like [Erythranthe guttata]|uniref:BRASSINOSTEROID INSENSITIVE 1-associated receptor kinase 1-like n=1 Tax=Erythranthe guttata TaxID=4155 RepID=UPI00064DBA34|nr:PREDICTED: BRASSINOSTEROID INSENSITIVE 1-associated receptor kinase 1-like [Erythranthe guttata]|eukprot:XP_012845249.1 PREDICTED: BRASSINOSTEROID INSENSITIVE 1-associated receptor kinase 1-like [Erythranthe guttata]
MKQEYYIDIPEVNLGMLNRFSLKELKTATENFAHGNICCRKGFCKLYKGELENGFIVAVKRFEQQGISRAQPLLKAEVETMRIAVHPNILGLVGVCITQNEKLLVYPFMVNITVGSCLRDRPKSQPPLDWPVRKRIALGAARGLSYMHDECESKIIHRDVKAANIYLNEDFDAIIGNFELAIPTDHGVTRVEKNVGGTFGHVAPEYLSDGICSAQSDVYSYGIFLLELVTCQRAYEEDMLLVDWVKKILEEKKWEGIVDLDFEEGVEQLIHIALLCTEDNPEKRPRMSDIVTMLQLIGDGLLAQRWEEFCNKDMLHRQELKRFETNG